MRKIIKKLVGGIMLGVMLMNSPVMNDVGMGTLNKVEAASCKNPEITKSGKWAYIAIHPGQKITKFQVDDKTISTSKLHTDSCSNVKHKGKCDGVTLAFFYCCRDSYGYAVGDGYYYKLSSGKHKIAVYTSTGHYTVKYITIK